MSEQSIKAEEQAERFPTREEIQKQNEEIKADNEKQNILKQPTFSQDKRRRLNEILIKKDEATYFKLYAKDVFDSMR